jgi:hypothetical protein
MTRWQFSLRSMLILMTLAALAVPLVAKYPTTTLLVAAAITWAMFESGAIFQIVDAFSKPAVYDRHPFLATFTWVITGIISIAASGLFWWAVVNGEAPFWLPLIPAVAFAIFGIYCLGLTWTSFKRPLAAETNLPRHPTSGALPSDEDVTMTA